MKKYLQIHGPIHRGTSVDIISMCIVGESSQAVVFLYVLMNVRMSAHISRATYRVGTVGE